MQGWFVVDPIGPGNRENCDAVRNRIGGSDKCVAFVRASQSPVYYWDGPDPLFKKYSGMPISSFMKEMDVTAASLGYAASSSITK
jgi:hypothetical protein